MSEVSMETIGPVCDAIQDSARALNLWRYAKSIETQLAQERNNRIGNLGLANQYQLQQQPSLAMQNSLGYGVNYWGSKQ